MAKAKVVKRAKVARRPQNRFVALAATCPRCMNSVITEKFIVNCQVNSEQWIFATFACPKCSDVVQVAVAGESFRNVSTGE